MKDRLWNLAMFLALKTHLKPLECSYEDPDLTEAEKEFLNSEGVATPRPQDFANARIPSFEDEKLLDIFFMVSCSAFVINNFLLANWNTSELKQAILINWDISYAMKLGIVTTASTLFGSQSKPAYRKSFFQLLVLLQILRTLESASCVRHGIPICRFASNQRPISGFQVVLPAVLSE
ncbi:hypothetical protein L596_008873 [Steinernema carpocapsae]|uniref:SRR1-like domain-containing protein n=1 Tax=Steinernema carpocapsae TaxID=34508 RepID=A0A4U5PDZ8_STECR|nr:hypothetical protein L596_008873 [Steinernema carpocapsae]